MKTMRRAKREIVFCYKDIAELSSQYAMWIRLHPRATNLLRRHIAGDPQITPTRHQCTISYEEDEIMLLGGDDEASVTIGKDAGSEALSG
jgi:hypothetical protein